MINPNKFIGLQQQQSMGQLTDPQSFQQQFNVNRFTQPLAVPGDQNQTMSPMMQQEKSKVQTVQNDPKLQEGSDASYGISGYVNTEKEYKQALQEKNHPNVYGSPAKQTDYPHAPKQMPIDRVREKIVQPVEKVKQDRPYRTGYKKIVKSKVPEMIREEPARIQEQVQTISPFRQDDPNKSRKYVVNKEKSGTSKDTLYLPKDAFVSKSGYVDDEEYERLATKASKDGTYNYEGGAFDWRKLEDKGKVKYKK